MLGTHILVLHRLGGGLRRVQHDTQAWGEIRLGTTVGLGLFRQVRPNGLANLGGIDIELA